MNKHRDLYQYIFTHSERNTQTKKMETVLIINDCAGCGILLDGYLRSIECICSECSRSYCVMCITRAVVGDINMKPIRLVCNTCYNVKHLKMGYMCHYCTRDSSRYYQCGGCNAVVCPIHAYKRHEDNFYDCRGCHVK